MYKQTTRIPGRLFVAPAPFPRQTHDFTDGSLNKVLNTKEHMSDNMKAVVRVALNCFQDNMHTGGGVVKAKQVRAGGCRRIEHAALACVSQLPSRPHSHAFPNAPADCVRIRFPTPQRSALACVSLSPGGLRSHSFPNSCSGPRAHSFPNSPAACARIRFPTPQRAALAFVSQLPSGLRSHSFPNSPAGCARIRVPTPQ